VYITFVDSLLPAAENSRINICSGPTEGWGYRTHL